MNEYDDRPELSESIKSILEYSTVIMARKMGDTLAELAKDGPIRIEQYRVSSTYHSQFETLEIRGDVKIEPQVHIISMRFKVIDGEIVV